MSETDLVKALEAKLRAILEEVLEKKIEMVEAKAFTFQDAATKLGVSAKHVSRAVALGRIRTVDIFGARRITRSEIDRVLAGPSMESSGASPKRVAYDKAAALRRMAELKKKRP